MSRILILDDDPFVTHALAELLTADGHVCDTARAVDDALERLSDAQQRIDLLITEMQVAGDEHLDGLAWLRRVREAHPGVIPLVVTGYGKIEDAVRAIKLGAVDYLTKPVLDDDLRDAVRKAIDLHTLLAGVHASPQTTDAPSPNADADTSDDDLEAQLGQDLRVHQAIAALDNLAPLDTPVLISGEAGTGRTRLAEALHERSPRKAQPCVAYTCTPDDDPRTLAELLGHTRLAFPEEPTRRHGLIGKAQGGTLIVRELHRASPATQAALLELFEHQRVRPIGANQSHDADIRVVCTGDPNPQRHVQAGTLRADVFYRANGAHLTLPTLRARPDDVAWLATRFVDAAAQRHHRRRRLSPDATEALLRHRWPGNRDELRAACDHAVVHALTREIGVGDLPASVTRPAPCAHSIAEGQSVHAENDAQAWTPTPLSDALLEPERQIIKAALDANQWNRSETARQLQIDRTTLYKKIKRFRLDEPD